MLQRALAGRPGVASVEEAVAPPAARSTTRCDQFGSSLRIGWLFALALAVLMAFNATTHQRGGAPARARDDVRLRARSHRR